MSDSRYPYKQSGFTLIELMVVMAIIAILATAGLSAYTGYIKKARDATRIADVAAMNTIVMSALSVNGNPPADLAALNTLVSAANNGQSLTDPLGTAAVCFTDAGMTATGACGYQYYTCDDGAGYLITAKLESKSNQSSYTTNGSAIGYSMGSCTAGATLVGGGGGGSECTTVGGTCLDGSVYVTATLRTTPIDASNSTWQNAIDYCNGLNTGGQSGWHSPSTAELLILWNNRGNISGFTDGADYWSNQQDGFVYAYSKAFTSYYGFNSRNKNQVISVRCVK